MRERLEALLAERILILDGAYGTAIQARGLSDEDYRGDRFRDHPHDLAGDPDLLNLTRPDVVGHPPELPGGRSGHRHHEYVHLDVRLAGGLRPRGVRPRDEPSRRGDRPAGRFE